MITLPLYASLLILIISGAIQSIVIPLATLYYKSLYFIIFMTSTQSLILFLLLFLIVKRNRRFELPREKIIIFWSGLFYALMSVSMVYSASPTRTPAVIQSTLNSLAIVPSVLLRKIFLKKKNHYNLWYIVPSLVLLILAIVLVIIPLSSHWSWIGLLWISLYAFGVLCRSSYSVFQERYFEQCEDTSVSTKLDLAFWSRIVQFFVFGAAFGLEYIIGNTHSPFKALRESLYQFINLGKGLGYLEGFIIAYIGMYLTALYVNSVSANFTMIASVISMPAVGIFFTVFPAFNPGIKYPWYIVAPSLGLAIIALFLWMNGEEKEDVIPKISRESETDYLLNF